MKLLFAVIFIGIFSAFCYFVFINNGIAVPSPFNEIYSDGWYGFSFNYPKGGEVFSPFADSEKNRLFIPNSGVRMFDKGRNNMKEYPCDVNIGFEMGNSRSEDDLSTVSYKGITWNKSLHIGGKDFYDSSTASWQTENNGYVYTVTTGLQSEKLCESLVSSFSFSLRKKTPEVAEAAVVRKAAEEYVNLRYSDKGFVAGSFIEESYLKGGEITRTARVTDFAITAFDELHFASQHQASDRKPLILQKINGTWTVIDEPDTRFIIWN